MHAVLLVPDGGTSAFLVIEHAAEGSVGRPLLAQLQAAWSVRFEDYTLDTETLVRPDAWLEQGQHTTTPRGQGGGVREWGRCPASDSGGILRSGARASRDAPLWKKALP